MIPRARSSSFLTILAVASIARCAVLSSPEPELDPLAPLPALYVVSAGENPMRGPLLTDGSKICPSDYPHGFSIECDAAEGSQAAKFFVNGDLVKSEYHAPYYIAGDYKMRVAPWTKYPQKGMVSCKLRDGSSSSAMVSFKC